MLGTGFPQGGLCSAKFWILAYNLAIKILNTHGVTGYGFADDSCTLIGGTNLDQMMSRMQKVINELILWGRTQGLHLNPDKTLCIFFTKSKEIKTYLNKLLVNGKRIEFSTSTKYLGVTLDHKLLWTPHITQAIKKAKTYLFMILKNVNTKYGHRANLVKWIYISIVRPRILYAYYIWGHKTNNP